MKTQMSRIDKKHDSFSKLPVAIELLHEIRFLRWFVRSWQPKWPAHVVRPGRRARLEHPLFINLMRLVGVDEKD